MNTELSTSWSVIEQSLTVGHNGQNVEHLAAATNLLCKHDMSDIIEPWFFENFKRDLHCNIGPRFWEQFKEEPKNVNNVNHVCHAFSDLYSQIKSYSNCFNNLSAINTCLQGHIDGSTTTNSNEKTTKQAQMLLKAIVFFKTPRFFHEAVQDMYSKAFRAFDTATPGLLDVSDLEEEAESVCCSGCDEEKEECRCQQIIQAFHTLNMQLKDLGLLDRLTGEAVTSLVNQRVKHHVEHTCRGNFESPYLDALETWLDKKVLGWLHALYQYDVDSSTDKSDDESKNPITANRGRLSNHLYNVYANSRIEQLFDIIVEYPESEPALLDLKSCLLKTNLRSHLVKSLRTALETRLLHPGVNTNDILSAYISAIRALGVLDSTGVLLELVCEPVKRYLRNREDTVRCIVTNLTEDSSSELSDELIKGRPLVLDDNYHCDDDMENWESWEPDPVDADPAKIASSRRTSDIISMLVNIYGSKELFVNEYRTLLADRILTHFNYDTVKEIRYLELLKLRFGESQLNQCEVMLKDVADSRRINSHITEQRERRKREKETAKSENISEDLSDEMAVNSMILSAQFWPSFREGKLELPETFQKALEKYTKSFEALKGNRTLNWKTHLGQMNIEIEVKDRKLEMSVSPVHAIILWHFQEKACWTIDDLSSVLHIPNGQLRKRIAFWLGHGLLKEEKTDTYVLVEDQKGRSQDVMIVDEEETESAMASASDRKEEELQMLWSYVIGMLTNLESLPLDRIHSMLKMFAMQDTTTEFSVGELKLFLDRKVKEQKLSYSRGVYRLPKAN